MLWTNNVYYEDQQKLDDVLFSKLQTHRKLPPIITFAHNNLHWRFCLRVVGCGPKNGGQWLFCQKMWNWKKIICMVKLQRWPAISLVPPVMASTKTKSLLTSIYRLPQIKYGKKEYYCHKYRSTRFDIWNHLIAALYLAF